MNGGLHSAERLSAAYCLGVFAIDTPAPASGNVRAVLPSIQAAKWVVIQGVRHDNLAL